MPSRTYQLFVEAMETRRQIVCVYEGLRREICPVVLGTRGGEERSLVYQFGGESSTPLPPEGQWKCFRLARVSEPTLREGAWHAGSGHQKAQACVDEVDMDANPDSPYEPRRRTIRRS